MTVSGQCRSWCAAIVLVSVAGCSGGQEKAEPPAASAPAASASAPAAAKADNPCPLTVEQVTAITGAPMTQPPGGCTFFPASGRDIPHVFYVLQQSMVCNTIQPGDLGFTEKVDGLTGRAFVKDALDGSHVLVCRDNARAFDIVVDIRHDKPRNREAAIALAKQVLAGR